MRMTGEIAELWKEGWKAVGMFPWNVVEHKEMIFV
jgi:hypothetical protein